MIESGTCRFDSSKGKEGDLLGPYPNPYRLIIGETLTMGKPLEELPLPLKINSDGKMISFIYDAPPVPT